MSSRASRPRSKSARSKRQRLAAGAVLATTSLLGTYLAAVRPTPTYAAPNTGTSTSNRTSVDESVLRPMSVSTSSLKTCADAAPQDVVSDDTELRAAILRSDDDSVICIDGTINLSGPLPSIDDTSLTLVGTNRDEDIISGTGVDEILSVDFTGGLDDSLVISNLRFEYGYSANDGGAVYFNGGSASDRLIMDLVTFESNDTAGNGGAVMVTNGYTSIRNSQFYNNDALGYGGAFYQQSGVGVILNSGFYGNYALSGGGAVGLGDVTSVGIVAASFQGNSAYFDGGALYLKGGAADAQVLIANSYVGGNFSTDTGAGAISVKEDSLRLQFSTVYANTTVDSSAGSAIDVGAAATLTSIGSVVGNSVDDTVIVVAAGGTIDDTYSVSTGTGVSFTGQGSRQVPGGSLQLETLNGPNIGEAGRSPLNTSVLVTGAPNSSLGTPVTVDQLGVRRGPGFWTIGARQVNPPTPAGCDVLATDDTVLRASILNSQDEDVICIDGTITLTAPLPTIDDTTLTLVGDDSSIDIIDGNSDRILAVDFSDTSQDDTLTITNLTFAYGDNTGYGGAIAMRGDSSSESNLVVSGSLFAGNDSVDEGGAIAVIDADIRLTDSWFYYNTATSSGFAAGGAVYVMDGDAAVYNTRFERNNAAGVGGGFGGAMYVANGVLAVEGSTLTRNGSTGSGGAISVFSGSLDITGSSFAFNVTLGSYGGGAVYARDTDVSVTNGYLFDNIAVGGLGGAILMDDSNTPVNTLSVEGTEFFGNEAAYGGGVFLTLGTAMIAERTSWLENDATERGGAIYALDSTAVLTNSYLGSNVAGKSGGSIAMRDGLALLVFSTTYDDSSGVQGAGRSIFADNSNLRSIGSAVGSPTDDTVIELTNGSTMDDTYSISTGQGVGFTGTGSQQVAGGGLGLAAFNRVGPRTAGRSPEEGSILLTAAPTSDLGTGVTVDQLGVTRGPRWTIGARQNAAAGPTPPAPIPPSAPTGVSATAGDSEATITWTAPASAGSFPITTYQAVVAPGGKTCLVVAPATECTITGLTNGTEYTATVRALSGAGWGAYSSPSDPFTPEGPEPPVTKTIVITGTRGEVRGRPGIIVTGATTGFDSGEIVRPWVKLPGQTSYTEGVAQIQVESTGDFAWQRRTGKKIYVFVRSEDGQIRSNRIVIRPR